jgi:ribosomal protein S18 acetylase RimI-like enzyme
MKYRKGTVYDLPDLKKLVLKTWRQFQPELTPENWQKLETGLSDDKTYTELLKSAYCIVCEHHDEIIGMAFLVPKGNATPIFDETWCSIRFVTVDTTFSGQGIGRRLTELCIQHAKDNNEQTIALHTSEMMNQARHIYESLGFKILKEIDERFGKKYWLYTLELM